MFASKLEAGFVVFSALLAAKLAQLTLRSDDPYTAASRAESVGNAVTGTLRFMHKHRHAAGGGAD